MQEENFKPPAWSRRTFLQTMGVNVPTLNLILAAQPGGHGEATDAPRAFDSLKFTPLDLRPHFTASPSDLGPRENAKSLGGASSKDGLVRMPAGNQNFRGIPFQLGPEGVAEKSWIVLSTHPDASSSASLEIPLQKSATYLCLAAFCDWDKNDPPPPGQDYAEEIGKLLAELQLVYDDGSTKSFPLRRRFEVSPPAVAGTPLPFTSLSSALDAPRQLTDPLPKGTDWGDLQTAARDNKFARVGSLGGLWVCALANPEPGRALRALRLRAASDDRLVVCGITLFHGHEDPLRFGRLSLYRFTLPKATEEIAERWKVEVDLGIVARTFTMADFDPASWLASPRGPLGERIKRAREVRFLYAEVTASPAATLTLIDTKTGTRYQFDLNKAEAGKELEAQPAGARVEIIEAQKAWLHGQVVDGATHRPTPVRLAFRSKEGRYIPPYGHRTEINNAWFQDYGADVKLLDTSYAYVDGSFQVELPVGEVYVEISKGFEYQPTRKRLQIEPGQRELNLEISRFTDLRANGWVTADTHVHFLSPTTAVLEGQAEGLNLISLLAAQWGDLFTNVGDLPYGPLTSRDGETMVQVNSENRQHLLGHLGLVGGQGEPVFPMSASGVSESYLGDPLWTSLAEWADAQRQRKGLVVAVHFPNPQAELTADIVLGKIDAVELFPRNEHFNTLPYLEWYRYLNCGYRLPAVGGTDKMGAYVPVGANRTYANLGKEEFNFANWMKAIRSGNTFSTTGPLLLFQVDGHSPGAEITLGTGGGTLEVQVQGKSFVPFHRIEVVMNGAVVASREDKAGTREMMLQDKVRVPGPCWLAARCISRLDPTFWRMSIAAHTSPVYVRVPGQELFSPSAAAYFLALIDGTQAWVESVAVRPDPERYERIRRMLGAAREQLHKRLHQTGHPH
jgi:hypothetical protein